MKQGTIVNLQGGYKRKLSYIPMQGLQAQYKLYKQTKDTLADYQVAN